MNLDQYLPVLLFILVGIAVGVLPQLLGYLFAGGLGFNKPDAAKNSPWLLMAMAMNQGSTTTSVKMRPSQGFKVNSHRAERSL